eukprot:6364435-Pyramimonas_sp.AAC.1
MGTPTEIRMGTPMDNPKCTRKTTRRDHPRGRQGPPATARAGLAAETAHDAVRKSPARPSGEPRKPT